jgi:hypothetical protein
MLQRIQSVFLALTVISMVVAIFFPIWQAIDDGVKYKLFPLHFSITNEEGMQTTYFPYSITAILMVAAATIAAMEIRRYDNRILQIKMGTLNSLILMGVMISCVLFANGLTEEHPMGWTYGPALYLSFAGVTFNWLAIRFIRRDEKLVKDSDRIR